MLKDPHISRAFDRDLEAVQAMIMKMGGLVEAALSDAAKALDTQDEALAEQVRLFSVQPEVKPYEVGVCVLEKRLKNPLVQAFWDML